MVLMVWGSETVTSESHQENAASPKDVTVSGMTTDRMEESHENALSAIAVTGFPS